MTQHTTKWLFIAIVCINLVFSNVGQSDDWMTWPSTYTHDPRGVQVDQYAMPVEPLGPNREDYQRSGYRHFRSTLQVGQSSDNYHVVEQFGRPIAPYEHWRFPFRPYGVPYDAWGPQPPAVMANGIGFGFNPGFFPPGGHPGAGAPGTGMPPGGMLPGGGGMPGGMMPGMPGTLPYPPGGYYGPQGHGGYPFGFPLQPQYQNQPWFDGTYPDAPPLDNRSDQQFFWVPPR